MSTVFADAFYFVARLNRHDQHHERVLKFSRDFRASLSSVSCLRPSLFFILHCVLFHVLPPNVNGSFQE
jgi:hypothetical protein